MWNLNYSSYRREVGLKEWPQRLLLFWNWCLVGISGLLLKIFFFPFNLHKQAIIDSLFPKVREGDSLQSSYKNFIPSLLLTWLRNFRKAIAKLWAQNKYFYLCYILEFYSQESNGDWWKVAKKKRCATLSHELAPLEISVSWNGLKLQPRTSSWKSWKLKTVTDNIFFVIDPTENSFGIRTPKGPTYPYGHVQIQRDHFSEYSWPEKSSP